MAGLTGHVVEASQGRLAAFGLDIRRAMDLVNSVAPNDNAAIVISIAKDAGQLFPTLRAGGARRARLTPAWRF